MVTMTVVTSPMKTIVPLQVLLVKVQRNHVMMVAGVSIPAGFVTVKLTVMMFRMRKAATVSTCCLFIVVVCWLSIMINHWSKSLHIVITNYGKLWISCHWKKYNFLLANKQSKNLRVIKVLNTRRETGFDTQAKSGKGPLGLAKAWGRALLKNIEILHLQRCFPHSEVSDNLFQLPKKDNFSRQFNHGLIPALR